MLMCDSNPKILRITDKCDDTKICMAKLQQQNYQIMAKDI